MKSDQSFCWYSLLPQRQEVGPCSTDHAVVWLADGRGACGAHSQNLARLPKHAEVAA